MPWYAGVRSIVYRTDVFKKAGVEPPTSWDELVDVAEQLKKAEPDMLPFPVAGDSEYGVDPFIWGAGGEIATEENGEWTSQIDSDEAREGIEFYTGLDTEHGFSSAAARSWDETGLTAMPATSKAVNPKAAIRWSREYRIVTSKHCRNKSCINRHRFFQS